VHGLEAAHNVASNLSRFWEPGKATRRAMAGRKKTEITIETDQVLVIRRRRSSRAWCRECGSDVDMVGLADVGMLTGISGHALQDHAEGCGWHVFESGNGTALICLPSLLKSK